MSARSGLVGKNPSGPIWGPLAPFFAWAGQMPKNPKLCLFPLEGQWALFQIANQMTGNHVNCMHDSCTPGPKPGPRCAAAEVQTFVKEYVDFLTSLWTLVRINLQTAAEVQTCVKENVNFLTSLWTLARNNLQTAAEVWTFVKKYVNFLTSFWTGRRFSTILLNQVFVLYVFYHVLRNAPHPAEAQTHTRTDN